MPFKARKFIFRLAFVPGEEIYQDRATSQATPSFKLEKRKGAAFSMFGVPSLEWSFPLAKRYSTHIEM